MTSTEAAKKAAVALLDVNALIALHDPDHVHHAAAVDWFTQHHRAGWATCALTQNGCVRVLCQPSYPKPVPLQTAMDMLARSAAHTYHHYWPCDISLLDATRFEHAHIHGHRQLTDLYLLALAVKNKGRLVTFDARIPLSAVRGAKAHHLVSI